VQNEGAAEIQQTLWESISSLAASFITSMFPLPAPENERNQ
jgi:hypothetical protein